MFDELFNSNAIVRNVNQSFLFGEMLPTGLSYRGLMGIAFFCVVLVLLMPIHCNASDPSSRLGWIEIIPGLWRTELRVEEDSFNIPASILAVKFDPKRITIRSFSAKALGAELTSAQSVVGTTNLIAAINANFFDKSSRSLGLVISKNQQVQAVHKSGKVLGGIFYRKGDRIYITHRDDFSNTDVDEAIQSGPRIIANGKPLKLVASHTLRRRSGIAITRSGMGLIYITLNTFPGASLHSIQRLLLDPRLDIFNALNLDGGGSSQIFIRTIGSLKENISTSGGDLVPTFLTLERKEQE